ncbi:MAG TPA: hypothetical protein PLC86_23550, partial [Candidatus Accumulibacter phosphatis]|nr:hypothetical protein [Candidatus Accumulibacter phosphatis]
MSAVATTGFDRNYELHLKHLKLKGLQPKTIEAYARAIRRVGDYFEGLCRFVWKPALPAAPGW